MNYAVLQCAVTKQTQEQYPDGIITKVGNDKYTKDEAQTKWHQQCVALENDTDTLIYMVAVVDSQLNIVNGMSEFKKKAQSEPEPTPEVEPTSEPTSEVEGE